MSTLHESVEKVLPHITEAWQQFFLEEKSRPKGMDLYQEIFDNSWLVPLQRRGELGAMMDIARSASPKVVMEIGAAKCGGLYHWIKCHEEVNTVIAVDIQPMPFAPLFEKAFPEVQFLWISGSSIRPDSVGKVKQFLNGRTIDCLFIDGDKNYFKEDFDYYSPMVKKGGIVFFHDIDDQGAPCGEAFANICSRGYNWFTFTDYSDMVSARMRRFMKKPATTSYEQWLRCWCERRTCGIGAIHIT